MSDKKSEDDRDESEEENKESCPKAGDIRLGNGGPLQTVAGPIDMFEAIEENVPKHPSILACGKRRTGKSTTLDNFMFHTMQHIPFGVVMTETKGNGFWQKRVPEWLVYQGWREDILLTLINRQKNLIKLYGKEDPRTFAFIILDDVIADQKSIRWSKNVNSFFVEGRHINITVLITTQYMKGIGPMVRGNMDIAFLQPIYSVLDRQVIYELYAGFLPKKEFMQLMDEVVGSVELEGSTAYDPKIKVQIMVVQDWRQTADPCKKFKYWIPVKSDDLPNYRLCAQQYWRNDDAYGIGDTFAGDLNLPRRARALADVLDEVNETYY